MFHTRVRDQNHQLSLVVLNGSGTNLLGCDWLRTIPLDWSYLKQISHHQDAQRWRRLSNNVIHANVHVTLVMAPLQPWEWPQRPLGHMFLVIVDAQSKWMEINACKTAGHIHNQTSQDAAHVTHGLPELLVFDNGSVFTSSKLKSFLEQNRIRHSTSVHYHLATNGLAEKAVQTLKEFIRTPSPGSLQTQISQFLFQYRNASHSITEVPPAKLLLRQRPRSILDLALPSVSSQVTANQEKQKLTHNQKVKA